MSYTKGPWELDEDGWIVGGTYPVCMISLSELTERDKADARLISAAPELLEALIDIADDYSERFDMDSPSTNPGMKQVVEAARAAIAKAKGEAK